jgi:hypothetical protein
MFEKLALVDEIDGLGDEPGGMQQPPEGIALAGEVVTQRRRAQPGVDADEERLQVGRDDVTDAAQRAASRSLRSPSK